MSGPSVGGGGRGDPFGNIFGSGGGDKQVYPPAPPGYKYVDLSIPQAPEGYSVAKMSSIANNQSTPVSNAGYAGGIGQGNAGLYGRGTGARTSYQFNAHSPEGIRERLQAEQAAKQIRASQYAELQGLGAVPGVATNQYGGGQGYRPPPSAMISGTPWATVNPGPGNVTQSMMPGTPLAPPAATPAGATAVGPYGQPLPSGVFGPKKAAPYHSPYPKGSIEWARDITAHRAQEAAALQQATQEAYGSGAAPSVYIPGVMPQPRTNAPTVGAPPVPSASQPPRAQPNSTSYNAPPPVVPPSSTPPASGVGQYVPQVLQDVWQRLTAEPTDQAGAMRSGIVAPNAPTAPNPSAPPVSAQQYDPINNGQEEDQ